MDIWVGDPTISLTEATAGTCPTGGRFWTYSEDAATGAHRLYTSGVPTASQKMLMSVYAKAIDGRHMRLYPSSMTNNDDYVTYDLRDGEIQATGGTTDTLSSYGIEDWGDGWYRCWASWDWGADTAGVFVIASVNDAGSSLSYEGNNRDNFYVCGPQLENVNAAPEFPSSYIPHSTTSATRVKDVLKYDGNLNAFGYSPRAGSIAFTFLGDDSDYSSTAFHVEVGSSSSDDIAVYSTGAMRQLSNMSGGNTGAISTSVQGYDDGEIRSIRTGIGGGSSYLDVDGEKITDSTADLSIDLSTIHIGQNNSSIYQPWGLIGPVKLYSEKRG